MSRQSNNFGVEYKPMSQETALILQQKIESLCKEHAIWVSVLHDKQPHLKYIKMEISIKIS